MLRFLQTNTFLLNLKRIIGSMKIEKNIQCLSETAISSRPVVSGRKAALRWTAKINQLCSLLFAS